MSNTIRHIIWYALGFLIFAVLIPCGLIKLSLNDLLIQTDLRSYILILIIISLPFFIVGIIFAIWSNISMFKIGKGGPTDGFNIAISPRTKKLVTSGPYEYTRNPMLFGAFCIYFSIGLFMLSITCLISLLLILFIAVIYLKNTEEIMLLRDFGKEYAD